MNLRQLRMERFFEPSFEVSLKSNRLKWIRSFDRRSRTHNGQVDENSPSLKWNKPQLLSAAERVDDIDESLLTNLVGTFVFIYLRNGHAKYMSADVY